MYAEIANAAIDNIAVSKNLSKKYIIKFIRREILKNVLVAMMCLFISIIVLAGIKGLTNCCSV